MYTKMMQVMNSADSRYLSREEQEGVLKYADSLRVRFEASREVERHEEAAVRAALDRLKGRYPNFARYHDQGWEKGVRDMQLVVRYMAQSMVMDDTEVAVHKLYLWLRTIIASLGMTTQFMRDAYTLLKESFQERLSRQTFAMMEPHFDRAIDVLSDFPEPASPAV
ncbi:MAG: hypothetical protein ACRC1K_19425 [Planctomycetia bacterium]